MKRSIPLCFGAFVVSIGLASPGASFTGPPEEPTPEPTKSPRERLSSYAKGKRLVRPNRDPSGTVVITDEDVDRLGYPDSGPAPDSKTGNASETAERPSDEPSARDLWRQRIGDQYAAIAAGREKVRTIELQLKTTWNAFYACDQPAVREHRIRPELIKTIGAAEQARARLKAAEAEVEILIEEAREAGAQPGWFRGLQRSPGPTVIGRPE